MKTMTLQTVVELDVDVDFTDEGAIDLYGDDPFSGGLAIDAVYITVRGKRIDITAALTEHQLTEIADTCADEAA